MTSPADPLSLLDPVSGRPSLDPAGAAAVVREVWGIEAEATPLSGERDRNFLLTSASGERFVLKISGAAEIADRLDLQTAMPAHARRRDPRLRLPRLAPAPGGEGLVHREFAGRVHAVRLLHHQDGVALSVFPRPTDALLEAAGRFAGRLQRALAGFRHPGLEAQDLPWAPRHAGRVIALGATAIASPERAGLYRRVAESIRSDLGRLLELPPAALHNDLNDDNLLLAAGSPVNAGPEDLAALDFGDALEAPGIVEAATAALYLAGPAASPPHRRRLGSGGVRRGAAADAGGGGRVPGRRSPCGRWSAPASPRSAGVPAPARRARATCRSARAESGGCWRNSMDRR